MLAVESIADLKLGKVSYQHAGDWIGGIIMTLVVFTGFFANIAIIWAIAKSRQSFTPSIRIIVSLCIADLILCSMQLVFSSINLLSGGWNFGVEGCVANAQIILSCEFVSINSLVLLTVDRYSIVMYHYFISEKTTMQILTSIWIASIAICSFPVYTGAFWYILTLEPSKLFCSGVYWGKEPLLILGITIVLSVISIGVIVISLAYMHILIFYLLSMRRKRELRINTMMTSEEETIRAKERKLIFKCLAITGVFFLCWICYLVKIIIEVASSEPSSPLFDSISSIGVFAYSCLNPFILYIFDASIRNVVDSKIATIYGRAAHFIIPSQIPIPDSNPPRNPHRMARMKVLNVAQSEAGTEKMEMAATIKLYSLSQSRS